MRQTRSTVCMLQPLGMDAHADDLLTSEAARLLGVAENTIRLWADSGRLPVRRTDGGVRLFRREDVAQLAASRRNREGL